MFKKKVALFLAMALTVTAFAGCGKQGGNTGSTDSGKKDAKKVGVFLYNFNDTYLSSVRKELEALDSKDDSIEFTYFDSQNDQGKQNDAIDGQLEKLDAFLVNLTDTGAADAVLSKIKPTNKPVILFNREPADIKAYQTYDKAKFIGTKIEEAGILQGEMIAEYWNNSNGAADRNKNGVLDYVLLHGGLDNAEAIARSKYAVETIESKGIKVNKIAEQIAQWRTDLAQEAVDAWLGKQEGDIDIVISNNDGMAIGAVNSLLAHGLNKDKTDLAKYIGVFGVDATEEAKKAITDGTMVGTVKQDNVEMAKALYEMGKNAANGKEYTEGTNYKYDDSGFAVRIPYQKYSGK